MKITIQNKSVYASDAGQGIENSKDTIIFLHGSGLSHIVWSLLEQFFSNKNYNVLSIDLPGHGETGILEDNSLYGFEETIDL